MKILVNLAFAVTFMFATSANATLAVLTLDPAEQNANIGDTVSVQIVVSELGNYTFASVGSALVEVVFDTDIFTFSNYSATNLLGDPADVDDFSGVFGNTFTLDLFSYLIPEDLWALQPSSFVLAELFFTVNEPLNNLVGALTFGNAQLWRATGQEFDVNIRNSASVNVPAPTSFLLIALGLVAMFTKRKMLLKKA